MDGPPEAAKIQTSHPPKERRRHPLMPPQDQTIVLRTVAGLDAGLGHLTRCLSLAQALASQGAKPVFAMSAADAGVRAMVDEAGMELAHIPGDLDPRSDLEALAGLTRTRGAAAVVLDGYRFDQAYLDALSQAVFCLYLDDLGEFPPASHLVLNQNPAARPQDYPPRPGQRLLLGLRYALLRPAFARLRAERPRHTSETATNLLVTFGGADPNALCARALEALNRCRRRYVIKVVAGGLPAPLAAARDAAGHSPHQVLVHERVADMAQLMAWADMALCGSGVTGYEMCCLGLPMVVLTPVDNQMAVSRGMERAGLIRHLGWWERVGSEEMADAVDEVAAAREERKRLSAAGQAAVDGLGAQRVAQILLAACAKDAR